MRTWYRYFALFAAASLVPSQASADFLVVSQNTLHLGQGSRTVAGYIPAKNAYIRSLAAWPGNSLPQLTFLQEVMTQADPAAIQPAGGTALFGVLKGSSSYLERYGVVLANNADEHVTILCDVDTASLQSAAVAIQRPPDATLVRDASGSTPRFVWILNIHTTFGSGSAGVRARRAEVEEVGRIISALRARAPSGCPSTTDNAVVLGDWNLAGSDVSFRSLATNAGFTRLALGPDVPTSLNARGVRASAYDHFVWDDTRVSVTLANLPAQAACGTSLTFVSGVLTPTNLLSFRRNCSDHLGVAAVVRVR